MKPLHKGKLSEECKFSITEDLDQDLKDLARQGNCTYAEICRELIWMAGTGKVYSEHIANDRRSLLQLEGRVAAEKKASAGSQVDE